MSPSRRTGQLRLGAGLGMSYKENSVLVSTIEGLPDPDGWLDPFDSHRMSCILIWDYGYQYRLRPGMHWVYGIPMQTVGFGTLV